MSRYQAMFSRLAANSEGAFGAFLMLGDPDIGASATLLDALVEGGADMVEVGIPFSDPVADGPVIQAAAQRALNSGVQVDDCFELIRGFRRRHTQVPLGILTYANLVMARGRSHFARDAIDSGADSLLIADLPVREAESWSEVRQDGLAQVLIAAANTPQQTLRRIACLSTGYTYCVSRSGITGVHAGGRFDRALITRLRELGAPPPVFGFGVSTPQHVRAALAAGAAGVITGSAIVDLAAEGSAAAERVVEFIGTMKAATLGLAG